MAAYTFEIGTTFFQSCNRFNGTILPDNINALTYAAKVARAPYLLPAGPEARGLAITPEAIPQGSPATLNGTVDDTRAENSNGTEPTQNIAAAEYYLDTPPWESGATANPMVPADGSFDSRVEAVTATIDTSTLSPGRHTVFVRGRDAAGNWGPVSAVFIGIQSGGSDGTIAGTITEAGTGAMLDATVTTGSYQTTTTAGAYSLTLPAGTYDVTASASGYQSQTQTGVTVTANQTTPLDFSLVPNPTTLDDILVGRGLGPSNSNRVVIHEADGTATGVSFDAYSAGSWGARVAAGDLDGPPWAEIVTGPGPGDVFGPHVRAFLRDGTPLSGASFFAYGTLRYGVIPGTGHYDADLIAEMVTGAGPGAVFGPHVRAFAYTGTNVTPLPGFNAFTYSTLRFGVNVAPGELTGSPLGELVTGPGPGIVFAPTVRGFQWSGTSLSLIPGLHFDAFAGYRHGATPQAGDFDADGREEIAVAAGPGPTLPARAVGFDYTSTISSLPGFDVTPAPTLYGAHLGSADLDGSANRALIHGAGPDPAADATVRAFVWDGAALNGVSTPFLAFGSAYGVTVAGGALGY